MKLAEIEQQFSALDALLLESGGEVTPEIEAWLAEYGLAEREKVDGYVFYIRSLEAEATQAKALANELGAKARRRERAIEGLKERVAGYMAARQTDELAGSIYRFKLQRNGGKAPLVLETEDPARFPPSCVKTIPAQTVIDRDAVREMAEADSYVLTGLAHLGERGRSLRIY